MDGHRLVPWVLLVLVALSGCASRASPAGSQETVIPPTAAPGQADDETCAIVGAVLDDEDLPVVDAQVGLLGGNLVATKTAADGGFSFSFVPAGQYQVAASKVGYKTGTAFALCEPGATVDALIHVVPLPPATVPYAVLLQPQGGRYACGVGLPGMGGVAANDLCAITGVDGSGKSQFSVPVDKNQTVTAIVSELDWIPTGAYGGRFLRLVYPRLESEATFVTNDRHYPGSHAIQGKSALGIIVRAVDPTKSLLPLDRTSVTAEARMSSSTPVEAAADNVNDQSSIVVYQQPFTFHGAVFYNGAPVGDDFSLIG